MELLTVLAGISSCVTGIGAALILLLRPVREALTGTKHLREEQKCLLRSNMLHTYYRNKERSAIRQYEYENFLLEYRAYKALQFLHRPHLSGGQDLGHCIIRSAFMENLGIASVAAITVITYLMGMAVRASRMDNKWIPILCGLLGGLLGLVSFYLLPIPDYPAGDPITAAAVGIVSGLAATGLHQAAKQLGKEAGGDA